VNASSTLHLKDSEIATLREALGQSGGSFQKLFQQFGEGIEAAGEGPTMIV
jgi:hypothetical protein